MPIGILTIHLHLPGCASLKEKRGRLKPVMARLHRVFNLSIAEMDRQDQWQESVIACALVSNQKSFIHSVFDIVAIDIEKNSSNVQLLDNKIEII
jgi:uncharacterized protein YlxP (DUF503 family)